MCLGRRSGINELCAYSLQGKGKLFTISIYTWRDVKGASEGRPRTGNMKHEILYRRIHIQ